MGEERDMSCHLVIGPLIFLCTLNHFIQHQHTFVHLANGRGERGRETRKNGGEQERRKEGREQEGGGREGLGSVVCTLDKLIALNIKVLVIANCFLLKIC